MGLPQKSFFDDYTWDIVLQCFADDDYLHDRIRHAVELHAIANQTHMYHASLDCDDYDQETRTFVPSRVKVYELPDARVYVYREVHGGLTTHIVLESDQECGCLEHQLIEICHDMEIMTCHNFSLDLIPYKRKDRIRAPVTF